MHKDTFPHVFLVFLLIVSFYYISLFFIIDTKEVHMKYETQGYAVGYHLATYIRFDTKQ